ncbi:hypothetical protein [Streptomyces sp. R41]|uniref:Uncharacterized protein n=1 Tax=Streptomyces sp. R41 TaxID=3238632 RepID=A0AB39R750_9ACTN
MASGSAEVAFGVHPLAPSIFQVPIGDKKCWAWRDVFQTYFQDGERLDYARVAFYGSEEPARMSATKWVRNPLEVAGQADFGVFARISQASRGS